MEGRKQTGYLIFLGYCARDLFGPPPMVRPCITNSSLQSFINPKVLESMIDRIVLHRLSMADASTGASTAHTSVDVDTDHRINKMVEKRLSNFIKSFAYFGGM